MDGILQFLLIAGIIVIGIVKQFKKEAKKNADNNPAMPLPEGEIDEDAMPIPQSWGKTYGGYIPEGPEVETTPAPATKKEYQFSSSKHIFGGDSANTSPKPVTAPPKQKISPPRLLRKLPNLTPNTPFTQRKKHEKLSFGRKYYNGNTK